MKADFDSIFVAFGLILNGTTLTALGNLFDRPEAKSAVEQLRDALVAIPKSDRNFVEKKRKALDNQLCSAWLILLHILNVLILIALACVVIIGPENIFPPTEAELAEPLTQWQRVLYSVWLFLNLILYTIRAVSPTAAWVRLRNKATKWLNDNESPAKKR